MDLAIVLLILWALWKALQGVMMLFAEAFFHNWPL